MRISFLLSLLVVAPLAACDACSTTAPPADEDLPEGAACETSAQCGSGLTCTPGESVCGTVGCDTHADCGSGAFCDSDGDCASNTAGGPCSDDDNCTGAETCQSGTCGTIVEEGGSCEGAAECLGDLVCAPPSDTCEENVVCTGHPDCGNQAFCDDGSCAVSETTSPCDIDDRCADSDRCFGEVCIPEACEAEQFVAEAVPPNVLIVLDRSLSMESRVDGDNSPRKWDIATDAVETLLGQYGDQIRFGLYVFPGSENDECDDGWLCTGGSLAVDVGAGTAADINSYLETSETCWLGTPIASSLDDIADYPGLEDDARSNFVLLITDGEENCDADPSDFARALGEKTPPVNTYVVGFGGEVDADELNEIAEEGGTARQGGESYYQADDAASLDAALAEIGGAVLGCEYTIPSEVPDPDQLYVFFDGIRVPRDPTNNTGWDYSAASSRLSFAGNACTALRTGSVGSLILVYGCPDELPPDPVGDDAGPAPLVDGGPPGDGCDSRCDPVCGAQACLLDGPGDGQCGACESTDDCCAGSVCVVQTGECIVIGG